jgi:Concanavalin A-like lectin/glucanases superfamily
MKAWLNFAAVCVIEVCSAACTYDNGGVNVGPGPAGTGGSSSTERPPPGGTASGGSGAGGTAGGSGMVGISSTPPPPPVPVDAALAPAADAAAPAPVPPDAAPDVLLPPSRPPDAPPSAEPDPFCPATPDLAVCLRFESQLLDESPNHLPVGGSGARFAAGRAGQALDAHTNTRVTIPESPALDAAAITVDAWVNARDLGRRMAVVDNPGQYAMIVLGSGSVMCSGRGGYALRGNTLTPGRWTHLACSFDATTVTLWVDGEMALQRPAGPVATEYTMGVRIGWEDENNTHFDGLIDNLRIWRVVRPADPIR